MTRASDFSCELKARAEIAQWKEAPHNVNEIVCLCEFVMLGSRPVLLCRLNKATENQTRTEIIPNQNEKS